MLPIDITSEDRELATLADLIELAGSADIVRTLALDLTIEKGRRPLVGEVVERILALQREEAGEPEEEYEDELVPA